MKEDEGAPTLKISWRLSEWFPHLEAQKIDRMRIFLDELILFNKKVNLVSSKTIPFADVIHFSDSILAVELILQDRKFQKIYDFGSGNGFPGIILSIMAPDVQVVLVDSDGRKIEFLKHLIDRLNLKNTSVLSQRIEAFADESIEFAVSRAFLPLPKALLLTRKIFKKSGVYYHLKSEEWGREVAAMPSQLCSVWEPSLLGEYKLPLGGVKFAVVKAEKF